MVERFSGRWGLQQLMEAGIIRKGDHVRRVVIDFNMDDAVTMYVERYADTRILKVLTTIDGIEIKGVPAPEGGAGADSGRASGA